MDLHSAAAREQLSGSPANYTNQETSTHPVGIISQYLPGMPKNWTTTCALPV